MVAFLQDIQTIAYLTTFMIVVAGIVAWRRIYSHAISDVQDRVIATQKLAIDSLSSQVAALTTRVNQLQATIGTIAYVLRQQGVQLTVDQEYVTFRRSNAPVVTTVHIRPHMESEETAPEPRTS